MILLGFLNHSEEIISLGDILELQTILVNNDKALLVSDSPGFGVYLLYEDLLMIIGVVVGLVHIKNHKAVKNTG